MRNQLHHYYLQQIGIKPWIVRSRCNKEHEIELLKASVQSCTRCSLHESRTQAVFARGNPKARLMIIGEAPGFHEDKQGLPFVGKTGKLLNKMLQSIGLSEEDVFIANLLKCRLPDNRSPKHVEIEACSDYLTQQIKLVEPILLLGFGRFVGQFLLNGLTPLNQMRKQIHQYQDKPVIISYHPAYLLRNPADKKEAFLDLLSVKKMLDEAM